MNPRPIICQLATICALHFLFYVTKSIFLYCYNFFLSSHFSYGWENQIEEVLLEMVSTGKIDFTMKEIRQIKTYLRVKIKQVLKDHMDSAIDHQNWLYSLITTANELNIPIRWRNPLGYVPEYFT